MANDSTIPPAPFSLDRFARLVERLSVDQLGRVPLDRLPRDLTEQWCQALPAEKAAVLRELMAQAGLDRAKAASGPTAKQIRAGIHWLSDDDTLSWIAPLKQQIDLGERLLERWRGDSGEISQTGTWHSIAVSEDGEPAETLGRVHLQQVVLQCDQIKAFLGDCNADLEKYTKLYRLLDKVRRDGAEHEGLETALRAALARLVLVQEHLSRYHLLRLLVAYHEMLQVRAKIEKTAVKREQIAADIERVKLQLKSKDTWIRRLRRLAEEDTSREYLLEMIDSLSRKRERCAVDIEETEIAAWLNALVDATLDSHCSSLARGQLDRAQALFVALLKYRHTAAAARTAGAQAATPADADRAVQALLDRLFADKQPSPLHRLRSQQGVYKGRVSALRSQLLKEFRAPGPPQYSIAS